MCQSWRYPSWPEGLRIANVLVFSGRECPAQPATTTTGSTFSRQSALGWLTDWADLVRRPPPSLQGHWASPVTSWPATQKKQTALDYDNWPVSRPLGCASTWRHAQLINCSAEIFFFSSYSRRNNNRFNRWESFPLIKKRNKYDLIATKTWWFVLHSQCTGTHTYRHTTHTLGLDIFPAVPGVIKLVVWLSFLRPVMLIRSGTLWRYWTRNAGKLFVREVVHTLDF